MAELLRSTSFRLPPDSLGSVYAYRAGERWTQSWHRLELATKVGGDRQLPYASLETALRVISGDFVRLRINPYDDDPFFIVSRRRLSLRELREALLAWETVVMPQIGGRTLADAADDLTEERLRVSDHVCYRGGRCPRVPSWVFDAGAWEVAYRLASEPLSLDDGVAELRIDTDAALITWDRPVRGGNAQNYLAIHRIEPLVITLPGISDLVVHLHASFVRLANRWAGVKNAWVSLPHGGLLLCMKVRHLNVDGQYQAVWADKGSDVLRKTWSGNFSDAHEVDLPAMTDSVRAKLNRARENWLLGKGPGQMFHEYVGAHGRRLLRGDEPVEFVKARRSLERRGKLGPDAAVIASSAIAQGIKRSRLVCLYATAETRQRVTAAFAKLLGGESADDLRFPADGEVRAIDGIEVVFRSPPGAVGILTRPGRAEDIRRWTLEALHSDFSASDGVVAAMVETAAIELSEQSESADPKHVIRRALAERGIVTQFISRDSAPTAAVIPGEEWKDHAAQSASWDLLRSTGLFCADFPMPQSGVEMGTWLVGAYVVKPQNDKPAKKGGTANGGFLVNVVAVEAGTRIGLGFAPRQGWVPLGEATAAFLTADDKYTKDRAKDLIDTAVQQLIVQYHNRNAVVFLDAAGCARLWNGLADKGERELPAFINGDRCAVVRVRTEPRHVPRPAGTGSWPAPGAFPNRPGEMNALVRLAREDWPGAQFYVSTPRVMNAMGAHRNGTRYTVSGRDLGSDWHALNMTEFSVRHAGPFVADDLYELSALLCRQAPTWEGTLNWPSPLHLARAVVKDHPGGYLTESEGGE